MTTTYIDGDIVAFRVAASCETEDVGIATFRLNDMIQNILLATQCENFHIYLTGRDNFRKRIDPEYKANRKGKPKPQWLQHCRDYLEQKYKAEIIDGAEADDALGIAASHDLGSIIASIDKDLLQIPGEHYNIVKDEFQYIGERAAELNFWSQMLIGDTSDNIKGVVGIGPVKAKKILDPIADTAGWFDAVRKLYKDDKRFLVNACLLWIQREKGKTWIHEHPDLVAQIPSELVQEVEQKFFTSSPKPCLGSGTMESDGTSQNGTSTEVTG